MIASIIYLALIRAFVNRFRCPDRQLSRVPIEEHLQSIQCVGSGPSHSGKWDKNFIEVISRRLLDKT
jgi:hypothetical protein